MTLLKKLLLLICLSISCTVFGQTEKVTPDARLYEVYSAEYLERLQSSNPFLIQRWNFYLDNAYFITDKPDKKDAQYRQTTLTDLENLNILAAEKNLNLSHDFHKRTYYEIIGTDKILVYYSGKEFRDALNAHLGRSYPEGKRTPLTKGRG